MVEAITSGVKGLVRKQERRRKKGERFYRRAATTLRARTLKKLTSKTRPRKMKITRGRMQEEEEDLRKMKRRQKDQRER